MIFDDLDSYDTPGDNGWCQTSGSTDYNSASGATASLHHAIHRSLMRSIARTNTQLTRLISHARLSSAGEKARELEAALHGQMWRAEEAAS